MSLQNVKNYLAKYNLDNRIKYLQDSGATVEEAAKVLGCHLGNIAKTMSFVLAEERPVLVVLAGDAKVDNQKFKTFFGRRPKMIPKDSVEEIIGHQPGGVCPFAVNANVSIYLDESLKRFDVVYPEAGDAHSAIKLSLHELEQSANAQEWIHVSKGWD